MEKNGQRHLWTTKRNKQLLKVVDLILKYTQTCGDDSFKKVVIKSHRKDVTQPE